MPRQRFLFAALGLLTLWRWVLLPTLELSPGEALAVFRVEHGGIGSFHEIGPLVTVLAKLGMGIGGANEFGVRFFAPLLALVSSLAVWRLLRGMFDLQIAGWAVVIVNVLPAFNIAAVTLTASTVMFALIPLTALCLRIALAHAQPLHWSWWAAGACVLGAVLAEPPALGVLAAVAVVFALPERLRHHLQAPGARVIAGFWTVGVLCWLWSGAGFSWPEWRLLPNLLRWNVLASPLLLVLFVLAARVAFDRATLMSQRSLPLAMLLPLAVLDFFFGPNHRWPDMGGAAWMIFAAMLLAHRGTVIGGVAIEDRVSLRTIALLLAALQSAFLLQTDFPRTLGLRWPFSRQTGGASDYTHFFTADPSRSMRGWRESAKLVSAALTQSNRDSSWFVLASDWRLAVELDHYLGQNEPVKSLDDDLRGFAGRGAIFVTDDPAAVAPPDRVKTRFARVEVLSVARVMHAGNEVRWLKIFACHDYRPPDS
ncbi:MAG: glycosyltransferase family 39 protein [Verrucomicrobiaceae bacterium]